MTTPARARTQPNPGGFMRSVMRHRDMDDIDEGVMILNQPEPQKKRVSCLTHLHLVNNLA